MLKAAIKSVSAGRVFTMHATVDFTPDNIIDDDEELIEAETVENHAPEKPASDSMFELPTAEIDQLAAGHPLTQDEIDTIIFKRGKNDRDF